MCLHVALPRSAPSQYCTTSYSSCLGQYIWYSSMPRPMYTSGFVLFSPVAALQCIVLPWPFSHPSPRHLCIYRLSPSCTSELFCYVWMMFAWDYPSYSLVPRSSVLSVLTCTLIILFSCFLFFLGVSTYYLVPLLWILFVCLLDALYDTFTDELHSHMYYMGCYTCVNITSGWNHHLSLPRPNSYSYSKFSTQVNAVAFPVCLHVSVKLLNVVHVCYVPLAPILRLASVAT